jgi:galactoside O-acetyltransferase
MNSYYSESELINLGFLAVGKNVLISKKVSLYGISRIAIGNNVRIDDYCVLSAGRDGIEIGSYVHIAVFCNLQGDAKISLRDFSGLSSKVSIYSSNERYDGSCLTNPTIPEEFRVIENNEVKIDRHVIIGSSSIVLPGVHIEEGCAIGAFSLVNKTCNAFGIYMGVPATKIKERKKDLLSQEKLLIEKYESQT